MLPITSISIGLFTPGLREKVSSGDLSPLVNLANSQHETSGFAARRCGGVSCGKHNRACKTCPVPLTRSIPSFRLFAARASRGSANPQLFQASTTPGRDIFPFLFFVASFFSVSLTRFYFHYVFCVIFFTQVVKTNFYIYVMKSSRLLKQLKILSDIFKNYVLHFLYIRKINRVIQN